MSEVKTDRYELYCGDCLEVMEQLIGAGVVVDLVVCDPPNGAVILFGQDKFTMKLMMSNLKNHRYNLIWDKELATGFLNANRMPLRSHEDICVFYKKQPVYNPQKSKGKPNHSKGKPKQNQNNNKNDCGKSVHIGSNALFGHRINTDRQGLKAVAGGEIADYEVIQRQRKRHDRTGNDTGQDRRQFHLAERLKRRAAEVHCCLGEMLVHLSDLRHDRKDHIRQIERDMRDQHRTESQALRRTELCRNKYKQQHHRDTGNDIGIHHRDIRHGGNCLLEQL